MADRQIIRTEVARLVASQLLAVLATQQTGQSYTSLVAFAASDDLAALFFATDRNTCKFKNIRADSRIALLIDNRSNYTTDFQAASAVTAIGTAAELDGPVREEAGKSFLARHPSLAEFIRAPATALLKVSVSRYIMVGRFQEVFVLDLSESCD